METLMKVYQKCSPLWTIELLPDISEPNISVSPLYLFNNSIDYRYCAPNELVALRRS
jgi:hypothetical protein